MFVDIGLKNTNKAIMKRFMIKFITAIMIEAARAISLGKLTFRMMCAVCSILFIPKTIPSLMKVYITSPSKRYI